MEDGDGEGDIAAKPSTKLMKTGDNSQDDAYFK
ncbi:unnamed protein product [Rodentolepis nana]|uniref:Bravo_FIGEY domain-containing protein n=1 Tax=Rodentolepis nana TaxID=102285 RepID=A0A0R3T2D5_RODNA|nr:unnamed protein product [Rodentolepis nana]